MDVSNSSTFIVLSGKTGSGKSRLLQLLESSGYPVINLEKTASHRGSAFGGLLLNEQPSQPIFENEIENAFNRYASHPYIFIEQKPSSLGKRKIPAWLYAKMEEGIFVQMDVDTKTRVNNILTEYQAAGQKGFMDGLHKLTERLPKAVIQECEAYLNSQNYEAFVEKMLGYYDQSAKYNAGKKYITMKVNGNDCFITMHQLLKGLAENSVIIS